MEFFFSDDTLEKLRTKHYVERHEVIECFDNRTKKALIDDREEHRTNPPTEWFISETDAGRRLKVVYIRVSASATVIRTAYEPSEDEERIYRQRAKGREL